MNRQRHPRRRRLTGERLERRYAFDASTPQLALVVDHAETVFEGNAGLTNLVGVDSPGLAATPHQNPFNSLDTNADLAVSPIDALLVINALNDNIVLGAAADSNESGRRFLDTSGDGILVPIDALLVINCLNSPDGECRSVNAQTLGSEPQTLAIDQLSRADRPLTDQRIEAGAAIIANGSYQGFLTAGYAATVATHQSAHFVDTESPVLQPWGSLSTSTSTFVVSGWGHIELDLTVASNVFDHFDCCTGNEQSWSETRAQGAQAILEVSATGNFAIAVTAIAADTIVGSGDFQVDAGAFTGILNSQDDPAAVLIDISGSAAVSIIGGASSVVTHEVTNINGETARAQASSDLTVGVIGGGSFSATTSASRYRSLATLPDETWRAERFLESGFTIINSPGTSVVGIGSYDVDNLDHGSDSMTFSFDPAAAHNHGYGGLVYGETDSLALDSHDEIFAAREELLILLFDSVHGL